MAAVRNSWGGTAVISPPNAPESSSARVAAASPLPETSTTATSSRSSVADGDDEVAGERRAAGRAQRRLGQPLAGQRGQLAVPLDPVAQVDEHRLALGAGHAEPRAPVGGVEDEEAQR